MLDLKMKRNLICATVKISRWILSKTCLQIYTSPTTWERLKGVYALSLSHFTDYDMLLLGPYRGLD